MLPTVKSTKLLKITLVLFVLINTAYFWEGWFGPWNMLIVLIFIIAYPILFYMLPNNLYLSVRDKFSDRPMVISMALVFTLLAGIFIFPYGMINFESFESANVLTAAWGGSANCTTNLKLKENNRFRFRMVCFGVEEYSGNYTIKNDTILFRFTSLRKPAGGISYAIIRYHNNKIKPGSSYLDIYRTKKDTSPIFLPIFLNNLKRSLKQLFVK